MSIAGRMHSIEIALDRLFAVDRGLILERIITRVSAIPSDGDEEIPSVSKTRELSMDLFLRRKEVNLLDIERTINNIPFEAEKAMLLELVRLLKILKGVEPV